MKAMGFGQYVPALITKLPRCSADGRSNVWSWECGHCGHAKNAPFDTRLNWSKKTCDVCGADNYVDDFDAVHARLKGLRNKEGGE